jgi:hypothetical protein
VKDRKVKHLVPAEAEGPTGCVDDADATINSATLLLLQFRQLFHSQL